MKYIKQIFSFRVNRFMLAGALNTTVNFAVLNLVVYGLGLHKIAAIIIATGCAIAVSFVVNRSFVFRNKERPSKKLTRFILVSALGVFVIQSGVYALCVLLLRGSLAGVTSVLQGTMGYRLSGTFIAINLSNIVASLAVMFWNYNGYRLFVFNRKEQASEATAA